MTGDAGPEGSGTIDVSSMTAVLGGEHGTTSLPCGSATIADARRHGGLVRSQAGLRRRRKRQGAFGWQVAAIVGLCGVSLLLGAVAETVLDSPLVDYLPAGARRLSGGDACGDMCSGVTFQLGPVLDVVLMLYVFLGLAIVCDDFFMASLENISESLKLSPDVAGATFLAAGSSAPELFTSVSSAFFSPSEAGLGTIVGSAMFNLLIIVALSAAIAAISQGGRLKIDWRPLCRDSTFYCLSIGLLAIFFAVTGPGEITWPEGLIMVLAYGLYVLSMVYNETLMDKLQRLEHCVRGKNYQVHPSENEAVDTEMQTGAEPSEAKPQELTAPPVPSQEAEQEKEEPPETAKPKPEILPEPHCLPEAQKPEPPPEEPVPLRPLIDAAVVPDAGTVAADVEEQKDADEEEEEEEPPCFCDRFKPPAPEDGDTWGPLTTAGWYILYVLRMPFVILMSFTIPDCALPQFQKCYWVTFFFSILWIGVLCHFMVEFALELGSCWLGLSPVIMGVMFLSIGTSLPDAIGSMLAAQAGEADMAIANAIGSNVFDILLGLGLPWFMVTLYNDKPFPVSQDNVFLPVVILFVTVLLFLGIMIASNFWMTKWIGVWLTLLYIAYMVWTVLAAKFGIAGGC
eukprot:TRINITY_DN10971_c0_g1_i1.p1 TRINITY_DN10971_c0_g1~~TRINITY_DN10971_c0_g1_i1.p1  ORF type:complete len:636 (+),score=117.80 TRINITY_DN10971_c0_g1_i1:32-1909(+)